MDSLRLLALGLLIADHVGMYYVSWDWHLKSPSASATLEPWMRLVNPWRMSLLFLISGAVTAIALIRVSRGWLRGTLSRLRPLALHPIAEGPLLLGGTLASAGAIDHICEPVKPLRRWLGLPAV
jgi:glucan biosynthesis protein C